MLYGIQAGFGSPQVPVVELLSRPVPQLISPQKHRNSNFLQVPDAETPRYNLKFKIIFCYLMKNSWACEISRISSIYSLGLQQSKQN